MPGRYQYQSLDRTRREIRILELLPHNHKLSKFRPACRVSRVSLDDNPPFSALSYVWGDQNDKRTILVDKQPSKVTRNLFEAMLELRQSTSLFIWIDAICINQDDNEEKGWQVALMRDIYQQAAKLVAWLGPSEHESDMVIDYLNNLGRKAEVCGLHHGAEIYSQIWASMLWVPGYMDNPNEVITSFPLDGRTLSVSKQALETLLHTISGYRSQDQLFPLVGIKHLFRRAWWGRLWVLQEITLPDFAYFACGRKRIFRRTFQAALHAYYALLNTLMRKLLREEPCTSYQIDVVISMALHRSYVMLSMPNIYRTRKLSLVALLRSTCMGDVEGLGQDGTQHLEATDPRDKIFALLGIARDQEELAKLGVFPDYTKSKKEVYARTMVALLQQGHVSMLSHCGCPEAWSNLPSWKVDWSSPATDRFQNVGPDHITLFPRFNASGLSRNHVRISKLTQGPSTISIIAICYDKVLRVGEVTRQPMTGTCVNSIQWLYKFLQLSYETTNRYKDMEMRLRATVRASHAGFGLGEDSYPVRIDRFCNALPLFRDGMSSISDKRMKRHVHKFFASARGKGLLKNNCADPYKLYFDFTRVTSGRSPFVTEKGHLGLTSRYVRPGDTVAIIASAELPFILRQREGGHFTMVSEAYVDGIMDAEAVDDDRWGYIELA